MNMKWILTHSWQLTFVNWITTGITNTIVQTIDSWGVLPFVEREALSFCLILVKDSFPLNWEEPGTLAAWVCHSEKWEITEREHSPEQ